MRKGAGQQPGNFLDKHAGRCSWSSVWPLSPMVQRAGSIGPLSLPEQAGPAQWCPSRAAGRRGPTLPVPTVSVRRGWGRRGALRTSTHLCPPEKSCPAGGGGGRRESGAGDLLNPVSQPLLSQLALLLSWGCLEGHSGPLTLPQTAQHTCASPQGLCIYCSLCQEHCSPRSPPSLLPASFISIPVVTSSETPPLTALFKHDLTP